MVGNTNWKGIYKSCDIGENWEEKINGIMKEMKYLLEALPFIQQFKYCTSLR